ncbi:MAG: cyclic nucleotide-binding domain-containing protein [Betaproteobacteria bacterium]|jgi:CRP-like cAMP-binding protein|nr:MAG: cyclic nucleotide-binding domain-containing protein [Betaproteobacteria bacterium]
MLAYRIELLQRMPIFGAIREDALQFLLEQTRSVSVRAMDFFFREHDEAGGMFVLETGRVAVLKHWNGQELLLRHLEQGDCFGEMALMDLMSRSASIQAVQDCTAIELRPEHLYRLFERDAEQFALIQMNMGREVSRRLRATDEQLFHAEMRTASRPSDMLFRST